MKKALEERRIFVFLFLVVLCAHPVFLDASPAGKEGSDIYSRKKALKEGVADAFPAFPETLIPGRRAESISSYPHKNKNFKFQEPKPAKKKPEKKDGGSSGGIWEKLTSGKNTDIINITILVFLVAIFVLYRMRAGKGVS